MMPRRAIVREPGRDFKKCISCHPARNTIDLSLAKQQHAAYRRVLSDLGLEVIELPPDDSRPDACFVEDNAVVHGKKALIARMARESRRGEESAVEKVLRDYLSLRRARAPATVEGGDVIHLTDRLISGISERTNRAGVEQMHEWLGVRVDTIEDPSMVHLKSYATYLGDGKVVASRRFHKHPTLVGLEVVLLPDEEAYAADTLAIGDTVLMASGRQKSHELVRRAGFRVIPMDTSEFEKCEGALTCLSILL